jgi:hypothetical protein
MSWVEQLRMREADFRRAPSAHNTQPWVLSYGSEGAGELRIDVDPARSLPGSDPTGRDLALGVGAFVESCLIVAAATGLPARAEVHAGERGVPAVRIVPGRSVYATPFTARDVADRRVARGPYLPGPVPAAVLADLGPGVAAVPAADLVEDLAVADRWLFATRAAATELEEWVRLTPRHPRYRLDGLSDRALALSRPEAWALAWALRGLRTVPVLRRGLPRLLAAAGRDLLRGDGTVLVLTASPGEEGVEGRVAAGRRLQRTWLALARHGLAVHPLSQLLDCPATAVRMRDRVGAEPLAVFRAGRPRDEPVRSARLPAGA